MILPIPQEAVNIARDFCHQVLKINPPVMVDHELTRLVGNCYEFYIDTPKDYMIVVCNNKVIAYKHGRNQELIFT